jgi:hypothetical protein
LSVLRITCSDYLPLISSNSSLSTATLNILVFDVDVDVTLNVRKQI